MGKKFQNSYYCILILALPTLIEYPQQIARTTIIAKNKVKLQSLGLIVTSILNLIIGSMLSSNYGAIGVSLGICITAFLNLIYMNYIYMKELKFDMLAYYRACYGKIIIPSNEGVDWAYGKGCNHRRYIFCTFL
jgi:O-antigen/teichoic acid export membrane protein